MNSISQNPKRLARRGLACGMALLLGAPLWGQSRMEYFWDEDPGVGRAAQVTGTNGEVRCELSTEQLTFGTHLLGLRALNGPYASTTLLKVVHKPQPLAEGGRVEYFWDNDPGVGRATPYPVAFGGDDAAIDLNLPTESLSGGMHMLGVRVGNGGKWSLTYNHMVAVAPQGGTVDCVEYFWDEDPGLGCATRYPLAETGSEVSVSFSILTDGLSRGMHMLGIRSHCGGWSPTLRRAVAIGADNNPIQAVEYFWDEDPGFGQATPLSFSGTDVAIVNEDIPTPTDYGPHVLVIRAQAGGIWGTPLIQTFCMNATPDFALPNDTVCKGEALTVSNLTIGATEQTTYAWDMDGNGTVDATEAGDFSYTYTRAGTYLATLTVKTVGDCETTCTRRVVVLDTSTPTVTLAASAASVNEGDTLTFTATAKNAGEHPEYEWLVNDEVMANGTSNVWRTDSLQNRDQVKVRVISSNPCSLVDVAESRVVTVTVNPVYYLIAATATEGGTVTGADTYRRGTEVTLTAVPDAGFGFTEWSDGTSANPYVFKAMQDVELTATFSRLTNLTEAKVEQLVDVYSVTGILIKLQVPQAEWSKQLPPGVYIVNGTKQIVR